MISNASGMTWYFSDPIYIDITWLFSKIGEIVVFVIVIIHSVIFFAHLEKMLSHALLDNDRFALIIPSNTVALTMPDVLELCIVSFILSVSL